ncbi:TPA: hypothetical protein RVR55_000302 [Aeromonas dhakensis]|nr:hypothetical protein [Aeromonas dhakensis]
MLTLAFHPVDTWFFRESRPMDSQGGTSLGNQFPPSAATLMGALRTRIGDMLGANWQDLTTLPIWWGDADQWGALRLEGPWLRLDGEDYLPCPANLLRGKEDDAGYVILQPGDVVHCDLGHVRLPALPSGSPLGIKPLEDHWIPRRALTSVLTGQRPSSKTQMVATASLLADEYRLGIAIDDNKRTVVEGQLYQTHHQRPRRELAVVVTLHGLPTDQEQALQRDLTSQPLLRLGGEGRLAEVRVVDNPMQTAQGTPPKQAKLLAMTLAPLPVTPQQWPLPGFNKHKLLGLDCWHGELAGYPLTLIAMASGKMRRQGGWDLARHQPRPLHNQLPAGTVFFFDDAPLPGETHMLTLDVAGQHIPLALGWWQDNQTNSHKE